MRHLPLLLLLGCPDTKSDSGGPESADADDTADTDTAESHTGRSVHLGELFPYDGQREAEYFQEGFDGLLYVEKTGVAEVDGVERVTWTFQLDRAPVGRLTLSADEDLGVYIHAWEDADGTAHPADPPIALTETTDELWDDAPVVTETAGHTFTVSLVGREACPVQWGLDWEDCTRIRIDDGDGDDASGPFFAGDYWLVQRYGPAWMHLTGQAEKWDLAHYDWEAE